MSGTRGTVAERLERLSMPDPNSGCVLWMGYIDRDGYGQINTKGTGMSTLVHVVAYELYVGPVPNGLELDHLCRVRHCRAEWHLEPVTHQVNTLRGATVATANAAKTTCANGHPFTEANTYRERHGWRSCRICRADSVRERQERRGRPRGFQRQAALL